MDKEKKLRFSIIVPTFNRAASLNACLQAIFKMKNDGEPFEVIVCDDGSTDETPEVVGRFADCEFFRCIRHVNTGPAGNRNRGIKAARGEYLLFIDDDVIVTPDLLSRHRDCHGQNADCHTVIFGYTPFPPEMKMDPWLRYWKRIWDQVYTRVENCPEEGRYLFFITNNLSISRHFINSVGGFDESFQYPTHEDTDLGYRLELKGMKLKFCREAIAYHYFYTDMNVSCRKELQRGEGAARFRIKHPETGQEDSLGAFVKIWRIAKPLFYNKIVMRETNNHQIILEKTWRY